MTLRWPSNDADFDPMTHPGMALSLVVSCFELYVHHMVFLFVFVELVYADYFSTEAKLLPSDKRSAMT